MNSLEDRITGLMLGQLRQRDPSLSAQDFERPIVELDLDSLDRLEMMHLLERELQVKADLASTAAFGRLDDFVPYFAALANRS